MIAQDPAVCTMLQFSNALSIDCFSVGGPSCKRPTNLELMRTSRGRSSPQTKVRSLESSGSSGSTRPTHASRKIIRLQHHIEATAGVPFFYGWDIIRKYTPAELDAAALFSLTVRSMFEPAGDECGTIYDDSGACCICGADAELLSPLRLDINRIGNTRRIARALSGEIVVEATLVEALLAVGVAPDAFRPVYHRESRTSSAKWQHLSVPNPNLEVAPATRFGDRLFTTEEESRASRCPLGHVLGLNILSEVYIDKTTYRGEGIGGIIGRLLAIVSATCDRSGCCSSHKLFGDVCNSRL